MMELDELMSLAGIPNTWFGVVRVSTFESHPSTPDLKSRVNSSVLATLENFNESRVDLNSTLSMVVMPAFEMAVRICVARVVALG